MANKSDEQIVLGLDTKETIRQINADMQKLHNQLKHITVISELDTNATLQQINAQISTMQGKVRKINVTANVIGNAKISFKSNNNEFFNSETQPGDNNESPIKQLALTGLKTAGGLFDNMATSFALNKLVEGIQYLFSANERYLEK